MSIPDDGVQATFITHDSSLEFIAMNVPKVSFSSAVVKLHLVLRDEIQ